MVGYDGNFVIISARDGSTLTKPRFQLVTCTPAEIEQLEQAESVGKNRGVIKKILSKAGNNHYNVIFEGAGGGEFHDKVPTSFLRNRLNLTANIKISK